jgi:hypothetical protein
MPHCAAQIYGRAASERGREGRWFGLAGVAVAASLWALT